nr:glycosyltransferase [Methylobacterium sp. OTU13CASTA1]
MTLPPSPAGAFAASSEPVPHRSATPVASLHLLGAGHPPCGIGDFSQLLLDTLRAAEPGVHNALTIEPRQFRLAETWAAIGRADAVVANFPVVAWKRALFGPLAVYALAKLRRRACLTILHEWAGLHRLRRLMLRPLLLLSDTIFLVSPQVREELAADPLVGFLARRAALMPVPPNLSRPAGIADSPLRQRLLAARRAGRVVLGHFGSIYPGKQPEAVLDIAAALAARGEDPLLVFIGSFIKASDGIEGVFDAKVAALGLEDAVVVSGYVASAEELFGLFETVDAFAYVLPEGLTARRASVLACVQAGRPVVVTAPMRADEFDHHPRYRELLAAGAILPVPRGAPAEAYAEAVLGARARPTRLPEIDRAAWFRDAADGLRARMPDRGRRRLGAPET